MSRARWAMVLAAVALGCLPACSGGSPSATSKTTSTTGRPTPTTPTVAACSPASVKAVVDFTKFGGTSSALAGAVLFSDVSTTSCALSGVPQVQVLGADGQTIPTYQVKGPAKVAPAVLTPSTATGGGAQAGASITFSSWLCATNTMSLTVRFPGWTTSIPAAPTASSGNNSPTPCSATAETDEALYMGSVALVTS
jgi:hypothetical protein